MGCHASKPAAGASCEDDVRQQVQQVTILVAGGPRTGKTSLCRRFVDKEFECAERAPFTSGARQITLGGRAVCINVIDMGSATPEQIQSADAVLLTVRADAKQPFAGMYKHADALALRYSNHTTPPRHSTRNTGSSDNDNALRIDSGFNCADSIASPLPSARSTVSGWGQSPTPGKYAGDAPSFVVGGCTTPGLPVVGRLDTGRGSTTSSIRERVPPVYRTLALNTTPVEGKDPFNKSKTRRRKRSFHADIPVAVAVTACDVVDSEEHKAAHPGHVAMLRSTAANWSNARRCRVTFLSAKSGIGVSGAMSHLVHEVATHRRRLGTQCCALRQHTVDLALG